MGFTDIFGGQTLQPAQVAYRALGLGANITLVWPPYSVSATDYVAGIMDVTPSGAGFRVTMPDARLVSAGIGTLWRNLGSDSFTIADSSGNVITSVAAGTVRYVYLQNNSTAAGAWASIVMGVGSSNLDAGQLAGSGLTAVGNTLAFAPVTRTLSVDYTVVSTDRSVVFVWTGGSGTITLPTLSGVQPNWEIEVRNAGTGTLTIAPVGGVQIDDSANIALQATESGFVHAGPTAWYTVGRGRNTQFNFTKLSKAVTGGTTTLSSTEAANVVQQYSGVLLSNETVVVPAVVQVYYIINGTTGAHTFTVQTAVAGGTSVVIDSGTAAILFCDGTNVINCTTSGVAVTSLDAGSVGSPSLHFATDPTTGVYQPSSSQFAIAIAGVREFLLTATGLNNTAIGATTPSTGAFTTLKVNGTLLSDVAGSGLVGFQVSAVGAAARTVLSREQDLVYVTDFDNGGGSGDSTRIQAAIDHIRALVTTVAGWDRSIALVFPPGLYTAETQLDMTALRAYGIMVLGHGATVWGKCTGKPVFDCFFSRWLVWEGLTIIGDPTDTPKYGIQYGIKDAVNESGGLFFDNVTVIGTFSGAAMYNHGSELSNHQHCRFWNNSPSASAYCLIMDGSSSFSPSSDFVTVTNVANVNVSFLGNKFDGCDMRRQVTGTPIIYAGAPGQHEFIGCYAVSVDSYIVRTYRSSGMAQVTFDIHCETTGCKGFLLVDNVNPVATVFLQGLKLRDNNHQGSVAVIDTTGTTQQVIFDGIDVELAAPTSGVPLVGSTSGASSKVLLSGVIRWESNNTLTLTNCRFAGTIYTETSTTIAHTIGSYAIVRRPNSSDSRVMEFKGETRFSGTVLGTDASNWAALTGSGAGAGVVEATAAGADTNIDFRITPQGTTGRVRFGTRTVSADAPITGYIEIKDAAGTVRKLALIS